jgi:DNA-binding beta-propeller fold protein YncE
MLLVAFGASSHVSTVWKVPVRANMLGDMRPLESKPESHGLRPNALIVSEQGHVLAVDDASGSIKNRLTFLNPTTGQVVLRIQMELTGIRGVAYSPKSGNLYALAAAQSKDEQGLFRLDDASESGKREIAVTKIVEIRRPAALAFGQDGALYVTTIDEDTEEGGGKLLKVTGGL